MKCKDCNKEYLVDLAFGGDFYHHKGFCDEYCMDNFLLRKVKRK